MRHRLGLVGAVTGGLAMVVISAMVAYGASTIFTGDAAEQQGEDTDALPTEVRDRLAVCVGSVGTDPDDVGQALLSVEQALSALSENPAWIALDLSNPAPVVEDGCPAPPGLYLPPSGPHTGDSLFKVQGRIVTTPSYFTVHVFVLPVDEIQRVAADGWRLTTEEVKCDGDDCVQVTTGLYVSEPELDDTAYMTEQLAKAIGVVRPD